MQLLLRILYEFIEINCKNLNVKNACKQARPIIVRSLRSVCCICLMFWGLCSYWCLNTDTILHENIEFGSLHLCLFAISFSLSRYFIRLSHLSVDNSACSMHLLQLVNFLWLEMLFKMFYDYFCSTWKSLYSAIQVLWTCPVGRYGAICRQLGFVGIQPHGSAIYWDS